MEYDNIINIFRRSIALNFCSNLIIVYICCAHFKKRILSTIYKKFPKYVKNKSLLLECMGVLIHTLDYLNYCYEQFMTILLTSCFTEARNCIININEYHSTKYKYNNNIVDIDSDIESNENLLHENYKLEGQIF